MINLLCGLVLVIAAPIAAQEASDIKVALVIGNGSYENVPRLKNPSNDSSDIATILSDIGFQTILHTDQSQGSMLDTLRSFRRLSASADIAIIYFAGHGIEVNRKNYLIPVDAVLETDVDISFEAVPLDTVILAAQGASRLSMVIVDACRNNPFVEAIQSANPSRSIGRGLRRVEPTRNTLVAFAAKEGTTAADGTGRNSPYADALIQALQVPNLEVGLMMRQVRDKVLKETRGRQEPFVYGSLSADKIFLNSLGVTGDTSSEPPSSSNFGNGASSAEVAFWQSIHATSDPTELRAYLDLYPSGVFSQLARARLEKQLKENGSTESAATSGSDLDQEASEINRSLDQAEIVELQERLSALGNSLGRADGIAGRRTTNAIQQFEILQDMPITGRATLEILMALRDEVSDSELRNWRSGQVPTASSSSGGQGIVAAPVRQRNSDSNANSGTSVETTSGPKPAYRQFCRSNSILCESAQCKTGDGTIKRNKACQLCGVYADQCK